ncbi:hypothetical protein OAT97_00030 [Gammaproteobacteria bacterium]|nr:hypothetical protein [Gammaproteobacteria bacterium]
MNGYNFFSFNLPNYRRVADHQTLFRFANDERSVIETVNGNYCMMLQIDGVDFKILSEIEKQNLWSNKHNFLQDTEDYSFYIHTIRQKQSNKAVTTDHKKILSDINNAHLSSYSEHYINKHYLVFISKKKAKKKVKKSSNKKIVNDNWQVLSVGSGIDAMQSYVLKVTKMLEEFNPTVLANNNFIRALRCIQGYQDVELPTWHDTEIKDILFDQEIEFSNILGGSIKYRGTDNKLAMVLTCKKLPNFSSEKFFAKLQSLNIEFKLSVFVNVLDNSEAKDILGCLSQIAKSVQDVNLDDDLTEEDYIHKGLQNNEFRVVDYSISIEILGNSEDNIKHDIAAVKKIGSLHGLDFSETFLSWAVYFSRIPDNQYLHPYVAKGLTLNATDMFYPQASFSGRNKTAWSDKPITTLKNTEGGTYKFNFQASDKQAELGHTFIIGKSMSGKSVFTSFLLSQALYSVPDLRVVSFDHLHGLYSFTKFHNGANYSFSRHRDINFNPLLMDISHLDFIKDFYTGIVGDISDRERNILHSVIEEIMRDKSTKKHRSIDLIITRLAAENHVTDLRNSLDSWSTTSNRNIFNADKNISFSDHQLFNIDFTAIIDNAAVLPHVAKYIIYTVKAELLHNPKPLILFIDEAVKYMQLQGFSGFIAEMLQEIRKMNGIVICATQSPQHIQEHCMAIKGSVANWFLFNDPSQDNSIYGDGDGEDNLGILTSGQIELLDSFKSHQRRLLLQTQNETLGLDIDLSHLGKHLDMVFNSSAEHVKKIREAEQQHGKEWQKCFL